jgi:hypothetical protein
MGLFPKDRDFFEVFDRDSLKITKASVLLVAFMENLTVLKNVPRISMKWNRRVIS